MILNSFNFKLMLGLIFVHLCAILVAPLLIMLTNNVYFAIIMLPSLLLTNTTWALIHEGIHSNINSDPKKNNIYSRTLSILIHSNFEVLRFGHLMHHRYNRTNYDLTEGCNPRVKGQGYLKYFLYKTFQNIIYYFHITIGLYLVELIAPFLLFISKPTIIKYAAKILDEDHGYLLNGKNILLKQNKIKNIKFDNIINIILFILIIFLYQQYIWVYFSYLLIRAVLISSVDNLPHYGASRDRITGSYNMQAPTWWQKALLNFNLHRVHHKYPNLAWHLLSDKFKEDNDRYDVQYFQQYFRQFKGVIVYTKI